MGDSLYDWTDKNMAYYIDKYKKDGWATEQKLDIKRTVSEHFGGVDYEKLSELVKREFPENFI